MEVKPTFFSVSGFLVPGVVLVGSVTSLLGVHYRSSLPAVVKELSQLPTEGLIPVFLGTLAIAALLAFTFALGAVLSDTFIFIGRRLILRPLARNSLRKNVGRLFAHETLEDLIRADMDARESYVYMQTCGLDLHWYAGRIRMMGSTGLALLIAMCVAYYLYFSWPIVLCFAVFGVLAIAVAIYRSHKFDEYISAASAVIARGGAGLKLPGGE